MSLKHLILGTALVVDLIKNHKNKKVTVTKMSFNEKYNLTNIPHNDFLNFINLSPDFKGDFETEIIIRLVDLKYAPDNKFLTFEIVQFTLLPKIERYYTVNYVKYPVYGKGRFRTKLLLHFANVIDPVKFTNVELVDMADKYNLTGEQVLEICKTINTMPRWAVLEQTINDLKKQKNKYEYDLQVRQKPLPTPAYASLDLQTVPSTKKSKIIRWILTPLTLGLSWIGYVSERKAEINNLEVKRRIEKNTALERQYAADLNNQKEDIIKISNEINKTTNEIIKYADELVKCKTRYKQIAYVDTKENIKWYDLRESLLKNNDELKGRKGVYVIWNKTKNLYYVGQTKDLYKRLFTQHFSQANNTVVNEVFMNDFENGNEFLFRYVFLQTKDELDRKEKELINYYDSFKNGYNKMSGNL